jgi:hypothetical protein
MMMNVSFLSLINKHVWENFKKGQEIRDFEFMFTNPKIFALIEKCKTLIQPLINLRKYVFRD